MHRRQDIGDAAIEAFFTGNGAGDGIPPSLAAIADELRGLAAGPVPVPSPALAVLLQQGFSTENGDPSATAASNVPGPAQQAAGLPKWRRRRMVLAEFLAGLSVAAKATFGVGVAMASVTAAGAAGALPDAVQNVVATGVEAVTPFDLPDSGDEPAPEAVDEPAVEADGTGSFGERVSTDARDGGVDGQVISEEAKLNGEANRAEAADGAGRPDDPGGNGAGRAEETPAADKVPASVPGPPEGAGGGARPSVPVVPDGGTDEVPDGTEDDARGGAPVLTERGRGRP